MHMQMHMHKCTLHVCMIMHACMSACLYIGMYVSVRAQGRMCLDALSELPEAVDLVQGLLQLVPELRWVHGCAWAGMRSAHVWGQQLRHLPTAASLFSGRIRAP